MGPQSAPIRPFNRSGALYDIRHSAAQRLRRKAAFRYGSRDDAVAPKAVASTLFNWSPARRSAWVRKAAESRKPPGLSFENC